jgi:hypothetical protein
MARKEIGGVYIQSPEDILKIKKPHYSEREFARLLFEKTELEIYYESTQFEYQNRRDESPATVPDFRVVNLTTGVETFIEITTSTNGKGKQKSVMKEAAPDTHYVVFHRDKLEAIQNKFPEYNLLDCPDINGNSMGK